MGAGWIGTQEELRIHAEKAGHPDPESVESMGQLVNWLYEKDLMKCWWYDARSDTFVPYEKDKHLTLISRVNLWREEGIIVAGPSRSLGVGLTHGKLGKIAIEKSIAPNRPPDGVCVSMEDGAVFSWGSMDYDLLTPAGELRELIVSNLGLRPS